MSETEPFRVNLKDRLQAGGGCMEHRGAFAGAARAQLQRRLRDPKGLAEVVAQVSLLGCGAAV